VSAAIRDFKIQLHYSITLLTAVSLCILRSSSSFIFAFVAHMIFVCRNGLIIICVNYFTSLFGGFCVFSVLGFMAKELGQPIEKVVSSGKSCYLGLVIHVYTDQIC